MDGRDRRRVERLCKYITRPPVAQDRLTRRPDGKLELSFKKVWRDGARAAPRARRPHCAPRRRRATASLALAPLLWGTVEPLIAPAPRRSKARARCGRDQAPACTRRSARAARRDRRRASEAKAMGVVRPRCPRRRRRSRGPGCAGLDASRMADRLGERGQFLVRLLALHRPEVRLEARLRATVSGGPFVHRRYTIPHHPTSVKLGFSPPAWPTPGPGPHRGRDL
ncbi:MAG: transposase [Polyangiaceae bacterium]|nr:transposase [Polyangiaceae bacterium]